MERYVTGKRGQAVVEFALVAPIFFLLVFGLLQFGLLLHGYLTITEAAREGARVAAVGGTNAEIISKVQEIAPAATVIAISPGEPRNFGDQITVTVDVPSSQVLALPYVSQFMPAVLKQGKVVMRAEQDTSY